MYVKVLKSLVRNGERKGLLQKAMEKKNVVMNIEAERSETREKSPFCLVAIKQ